MDGDGIWDSQCVRSLADAGGLWRGDTDRMFGGNLAYVGDVTDDGVGDVVVTDYDLASYTYTAYILPGPLGQTGTTADAVATLPGLGFSADSTAASSAGDANGDGIGDLWLPNHDHADGGVMLLEGPVAGTIDPNAAVAFLPSDVGYSFLGGEDLNGDGFADFVGTEGGSSVRVFHGPFEGTLAREEAALHLTGDTSTAGATLAPAGDTDGDGMRELLIVTTWDRMMVLIDGDMTGTVLAMEEDPPAAGIKATILHDLAGAAAPGDVDGDGHDDLVVATRAGTTVGAYVLSGPVTGSDLVPSSVASFNVTAVAVEPDGIAPTALGDLTGDGLADWAVTGGLDGFVVPIAGGLGGTMDLEELPMRWNAEVGSGSTRRLALGDTDGDGQAELLFGAPRTAGATSDEGALYVLGASELFPN